MKFTKTILDNGLRLITVPMEDNPAVTVLVMVEAGSKYESKKESGLSHFLEHMIFKGTPRRPKASDIARELDRIGAHYNAFTGQEYTGYYAKVDRRHLDTALDIVSDMYLHPLLLQSEIDKEKGVIVEEIKMYNDLPQRHVHEVLSRLMFGDQPAGWDIAGTEESVRSFNHDDFVQYQKKHYVASATMVIVSGAISEKEVIEKVFKMFSNIPTAPKSTKIAVIEHQTKPEIALVYKKTDQTHLVIGIRTFSTFDKRIPVMRILTSVLGFGMSSRLFSKMRDELGICYYIRASHNAHTDHGDFTISAGVDNTRVDMGIENIMLELKKLTTELVTDDELQKAKDGTSGTAMLELETSDAQAEFVGGQEVLNKKIKLPDELIEQLNKVTAEEVRDLAREIFVDKGLNMAIIGPYEDKARFEKLLTFDTLQK